MFEPRCPRRCAPAPVCTQGQDQQAMARAAAIAQANTVGGRCQDLFDSQVDVIVEPAMITAPNIINHHKRIEHIVPIITEEIHQHHNHHEFVARPESRMRQTFDADFTAGQPLPPLPVLQPEQLVPLEVDVIERFGVNPYGTTVGNQMTNLNSIPPQSVNLGNFVGQTQVAPLTQTLGQTQVAPLTQTFGQLPRQAGFIG